MPEPHDVLYRWTDAFNAGDYAAALECMAPDIEYHELPGMPGARRANAVYRGHEEVVPWLREFLSGWETFRSEPGAVTDLGDGRVVMEETWRARGRQSGVDVEMRAAGLHTIRDGKIARTCYFRSTDEALKAVEGGF